MNGDSSPSDRLRSIISTRLARYIMYIGSVLESILGRNRHITGFDYFEVSKKEMNLSEIFEDIMDSRIRMIYESDLDRHNSEFVLSEGLIVTHDISKSIGILHRKGFKITTQGRKFDVHGINPDRLSELIELTNNLGWFPAYIKGSRAGKEVYGVKYTEDNFKTIAKRVDDVSISFEAKYDIEVEDVQRYYYHLTLRSRLDKIMKVGLTPKSRSKISAHPDRIYLGNSIEAIDKLKNKFSFKSKGGDDYVVLKIDTDLIPSYFRVFEDVNFIGFGVYTLNTIPPVAISVEGQ